MTIQGQADKDKRYDEIEEEFHAKEAKEKLAELGKMLKKGRKAASKKRKR